uniref:F-box protein At1g47790 family n=1 Tax=Cajanus cajan TaxID=3821 RepID=A0A151R9E9_CAJCA|nr:Putative F-box protein At1g47790 family [Cajanus cajan]KYP59902.1 Putative F-box protein At1g47790 family [Cajanus cajan]
MDLSCFPFDLVLEIIVRLPSKSVAKFRCVSRQWCRVLSDPMFLQANYIAGGVIKKPIFINSLYRF